MSLKNKFNRVAEDKSQLQEFANKVCDSMDDGEEGFKEILSEKQIEKLASEVAIGEIEKLKNPKYLLSVNLGIIYLSQIYSVSFTTELNANEFSINEDDSANVNIERQLNILYTAFNSDNVIEQISIQWGKVIINVEEGSMTDLSILTFDKNMLDSGDILLYVEGEEEPHAVFSV